jgi:secreted trypsin-like serine protease
MKYNKITVFIFCILAFLAFFSGIIRHDVKEARYLKLAQQKQFDCVGQIFKDTTVSGSCVLISDRFVLSAAHIFIDCDTRPDTIQLNGQTIIAYVSYNERVTDISKLYVLFNGHRVRAKKLLIHPNYSDSLTKGTCDIALIELENPLTEILPAKLNTGFDELKANVVGVGYGASGPANRPDLVALQNKKIAGENVVDSITGPKFSGVETLLMCDFDHPTQKDCNKMGSSTPRPLEYISSGGDSGGGLFRRKGKGWELIGICSFSGTDIEQLMKTGYYGQTMHWTRVSAFANWINIETK